MAISVHEDFASLPRHRSIKITAIGILVVRSLETCSDASRGELE